jgi:hypothetical protein
MSSMRSSISGESSTNSMPSPGGESWCRATRPRATIATGSSSSTVNRSVITVSIGST